MWSPKGHTLMVDIPRSNEIERIAATRWEGMEMKARYLEKGDAAPTPSKDGELKGEFRKICDGR